MLTKNISLITHNDVNKNKIQLIIKIILSLEKSCIEDPCFYQTIY